MAGYLFSLGEGANVAEVMKSRVFSNLMNPQWKSVAEGTLGDYAAMRPGDNVYFFASRKVYGVGEVLDVGSGQCVVENIPGATSTKRVNWEQIADKALYPFYEKKIVSGKEVERVGRWLISFKPAPLFFQDGVDMDDLLESNPSAFRSLRVFWRRSFIKLDDEENLAFKTALIRRNLAQLNEQMGCIQDCDVPKRMLGAPSPNIPKLLSSKRKTDGTLTSESLLEAGIMYQLAHFDGPTCEVFGRWDYLDRQVNASTFKPIVYMDKIDFFGYKWIEEYRSIIERYLVVELKKDKAEADDALQIMKYVDWVNEECAHGDYSLIDAFLVAHQFSEKSAPKKELSREYVVGRRPAVPKSWSNLKYVTYYVTESGYIRFKNNII